jgi:hypothetical protein
MIYETLIRCNDDDLRFEYYDKLSDWLDENIGQTSWQSDIRYIENVRYIVIRTFDEECATLVQLKWV